MSQNPDAGIDSPGTPAPRKWTEDALVLLAMAGGFFFLYLRTLCPTVFVGDSGEISGAIATGGIIHPPGYPLFSLLGRIALWVVPAGEPAYRVGCLVAAAAALSVGVVYLLARELSCARWTAAAAAGVFGAGHTFWNQSTRVEVYSLHLLLAGLVLLGALRYRRTGRLGDLALSALAGSLGTAHHLTIVLMAPAVLLLAGRRLAADPGLGRRLLTVAALLPAGPALYLLLMFWARQEPLQCWGHPVTFPLLFNHASARLYQGMLHPPSGPDFLVNLRLAAEFFLDNFPFGLALLPLAGARALWKRDRARAGALILTALIVTAYNFCYKIPDKAAYYLAVWMIGALLLAAALEFLRGLAPEASGRPLLIAGVMLLLLGVPLCRNWASCDLSRATWAREFARNKLASVDRNGVLITQGDHDTFPLWYVQTVLKERPDVQVLDRQVVADSWNYQYRDPSLWYMRRLRAEGLDVPLDARDEPAVVAERANTLLIRLLTGPLRNRPVFSTFDTPNSKGRGAENVVAWMRERYYFHPQGLVMRLRPQGEQVALDELIQRSRRLWDAMELPKPGSVNMDQDMDPDYVVNYYACMLVNLGKLYELAGDPARAEAVYRGAVEFAPKCDPAREALNSMAAKGRPTGMAWPGAAPAG